MHYLIVRMTSDWSLLKASLILILWEVFVDFRHQLKTVLLGFLQDILNLALKLVACLKYTKKTVESFEELINMQHF